MRAILTLLVSLLLTSGCALKPAPAVSSSAVASSEAEPKAGSELARFPTGSEFAECMLDPQLPHPDEEGDHTCGDGDYEESDDEVDGGFLEIDPLEPAALKARQRKLEPRCKRGNGKACFELLYDAGRQISLTLTQEEEPEDAALAAVEKALERACRVAPRTVCEATGKLIAEVPDEAEQFYERQEPLLDTYLVTGKHCRTASVLSCKAVTRAYFTADASGLPYALAEACDRGRMGTCYHAADQLEDAIDDAADEVEEETLRKLAIKAGHRGVGLYEQACRQGKADACSQMLKGIDEGRAGKPDPVRAMNVLGPLCDAGRHDGHCDAWARDYSRAEDDVAALFKPLEAADLVRSACTTRRRISACIRRLRLLDQAKMPLRSHEARQNLYATGRAGCMSGTSDVETCITVSVAAHRLQKPTSHVNLLRRASCQRDPSRCYEHVRERMQNMRHAKNDELDEAAERVEVVEGLEDMLLETACAAGSARSCYERGRRLTAWNSGDDTLHSEALGWFYKGQRLDLGGCASVDGSACVRLAHQHYLGCGMEADEEVYLALNRKACLLGDEFGCSEAGVDSDGEEPEDDEDYDEDDEEA